MKFCITLWEICFMLAPGGRKALACESGDTFSIYTNSFRLIFQRDIFSKRVGRDIL